MYFMSIVLHVCLLFNSSSKTRTLQTQEFSLVSEIFHYVIKQSASK